MISKRFVKNSLAQMLGTLLVTSPVAVSAAELEEVKVTAERVESSLSDTPVAVTAVSGESLQEEGITEVSQLDEVVPNLKIDSSNETMQVTIRSISSNDSTEKGDPSASVMFDNVYIARPETQNAGLFDIDRVEVLRGPQGTLWGRNTTAGVINVLTNKPEFEFKGKVDATVGNYGARQANAMVNMPVSDHFALRAAVAANRRDSHMIDVVEQQFDDSPVQDDTAGRLSALWNANEFVSLLVRADYADIGGMSGSQNAVRIARNYGETIPGEVTRQIGDRSDDMRTRNWALAAVPERDNRIWGVSAEFNWAFPDFALSYVGSYRQFDRHETLTTTSGIKGLRTGDYGQRSHELLIAKTTDTMIAQAGLYYFEEESDILLALFDHPVYFPDFGPSAYSFAQNPTIAENSGIFAQISYKLTEQLNLTAGVRYSSDHKERTGATVLVESLEDFNPEAALAFGGFWKSNSASRDWSRSTWRFGLDYHLTDDAMLYGSFATGYKAGGFNDGCEAGNVDSNGILCNFVKTEDELYYEPELLDAYETGFRSEFWDNRARVSATAFYYDYSNMQLSSVVVVDNAPQSVIQNAGRAEIRGVESEMEFVLADRHELDLSLTVLDAKFKQYDASLEDGGTIDFSGKDLDRSPELTFSLSYTYTQAFSGGASIDYNLRTSYSDSYVISNQARIFGQPGYSSTGVAATYHSSDDSWYIRVFARNLEDELQLSAFTPVSTYSTGPRTWGAGAGIKF